MILGLCKIVNNAYIRRNDELLICTTRGEGWGGVGRWDKLCCVPFSFIGQFIEIRWSFDRASVVYRQLRSDARANSLEKLLSDACAR